jgi:hypothetical protein
MLPVIIVAFGLAGCSDDPADCVDGDGDGYGVGSDCRGADCDDADPAVHATIAGYPDADGDGINASTAMDLCEPMLPTGYSATAGTDCADDDPDVWDPAVGYVDADLDGYGVGQAVDLCIGEVYPAGHSAVSTDCDDTDADAWEMMLGFTDEDGDGVIGDLDSAVCGNGLTFPAGWQAEAGDDCDDRDLYSWDVALHIGCVYPGVCVDSEGLMGFSADYRGVGACQTVDCNGMDVACWEPATDTEVDCASDAFCDAGLDEFCHAGTCWRPAACCNYEVDGLTCSEIPACLQACDPLGDPAAYVGCLQFDCFEAATSRAQVLYGAVQSCAADHDCFIAEDLMVCVAANCAAAGLDACLDDF